MIRAWVLPKRAFFMPACDSLFLVQAKVDLCIFKLSGYSVLIVPLAQQVASSPAVFPHYPQTAF
jgi:hypothetical protein